MNIQALYLYPVKSLSGISVDSFALDDFGPVGDRRWMIVDTEHQFVSQRSHPELALVAPRLDGRDVLVSIPGQGEFRLTPGSEVREVGVWKDSVQAVVAEAGPSEALSRYCGKSVLFVYMPDSVFRRVDPDRVPAYRRVSFVDGFPLLVTNEASLKELNSRLANPIEMRRFRPNVVVSGGEPWEEDNWKVLVVRDISVSLVKPCSRCIVTAVDPDTGIRSSDGQPLKTLATYRRTPDGVIFGVNGVHNANGSLSVGDTVTPG